MHSIFSTPETMSPETHMRLAEPFPSCAKSVRHFNGVTSIHGATREDFEEDPWMTVVPCMDRHLDGWHDVNWAAMESRCPWASQYKFANMLEFGDFITLPDAVLGHKFLSRMRRTLSFISRHFSHLEYHYVTSSPRAWTGSRKQELLDCARHCSFLEHYPLRCPGLSPQVVSYCCVRLIVSGTDFTRVMCVATCNKSRKLVDAVVLVSRNEVSVGIRSSPFADCWRCCLFLNASSATSGVDTMSTSRGEEQPTGTSGRESTNAKLWSNHAHTKWFVDWCFLEDDEPMKSPCGPVIFVEDRKGRRVLGSVKGWQPSENHDKQCYLMHVVYNSKGDVLAGAKGAILSWDLFQGFGGGALRTPFYATVAEGDLVSAREFFYEVEKSDFDLDDPCQISSDLELSLPVQCASGSFPVVQYSPGRVRKWVPVVQYSPGRALLGTDVAVRYNFKRWPARMVYFSDEDFEGYFLVSAEDNKKDLKAPPRQLKLSMRDIRWCWKELGYPKVVMGNLSGKQAEVEAWRRFCAEALHRTPYNHLWTLADDKTEQGIKKQNAALQSYFPLAMVWKSAWETGMEFFERWETGRLLAPEGAKWIAKKKKLQGLKPGVSHIENEKDGRKVFVYNVPIEGPQKKGKKEKESGDWFVQVTEPDPHCWKSMEALTDNEKCRLLKDVLNCEVVWVQTGSSAGAKQGTLRMHKAVQLVKCDRILDVTSIAPFGVNPLDAQMKVVELERAVGITKCHTCVLDLCEPVDIKQWTAKVFESLNALLEHLFPSHWTVVAFVPREHDYYFMTSLHHLSVVKAMAGKWVRRTQQKKSFGVGHNLYSLDDRMYILFKGDDLRENTSIVYGARLAAGDAAAVGALQKVTPTEISDMPFDACEWPVVIHGRDPVVYKGHEWNPTQFAHLLEFLCKKGDGIMFLGKAHAQVVWEVLKGGRKVIALEGNSEWLQFTLDFLKTAVNSGAYRCEFITKCEKPRRVWDPSTDMWFKLSARKRSRIYEFLFLEKQPARGTDIEYMRRKEHMLALLDNYHGATRLNAKNFPDRLELLYFVESEPVLRLESYGALIDADEESLTGVVFDTGAPEEDSNTEEIDIDYRLAPVLPSPTSSSTSPSTNRPAQATPMQRTPSKLLARLTLRHAAPPPLRPGCQVPLQHPSRKDENIHFEGHDHTRSTEADWGHDMIWHPGTIQPAIRKGEWVMAIVDTDGEWKSSERLAKSDYLDIARSAVVDKAALPSWTAFGSSGEVGRGSCAGDPVSAVKGKSAGIPTRADDVQASVPVQWSSTGAHASEMGTALAVREATPPTLRQGRSAESQREIAGAAPSAFLATKSAGIRTTSVTCLQSEEAGTAEGATSVHTDDRSLGSTLMRLQGSESRETDGGEEWVEVEGGEEGGE
ncbi:hypothetical protein CBR_g41075 [Chara braunii]|uniref:Uncharacterized protein n=1 Tax=Chara braunii TaxID=69332 RepID=A0A388LV83_CHABU|nr:hypothetical protein CBR_g41075 [Chara braunii]|eukprot:GBG86171.1 hypothetical protein CBR_g41075 [Chara braunii]